MKIVRKRFIILKNNNSEILCGLAQQYYFKKIAELGNTVIKTYNSEKRALAALNCWNENFTKDCVIKEVTETIEDLV